MKDEQLIEVKEAANNEVRKDSSKSEETENFATEVFNTFQSYSKFIVRGMLIVWAISSIFWAALYFWNDQKWRELFNSYDYISQDGSGFNNINSGDQGNLDNSSDDAE